MILRGLNVEMARKRIGNEELAEKTGLTPQYISRLKNDEKVNPTLNTIRKIADALDVDIKEIV